MTTRVHPIQAGLGYAFLVQSDSNLVLVDTGSAGQTRPIQERIERLAPARLRLILLTHAHLDHAGSAAALRRLTGAPLAIHPADAPALSAGHSELASARAYGWVLQRLLTLVERISPPEPASADLLLSDGMDLSPFGLAATVVHTPGHTPGSCSLIVEGELALVGDLVQRRPYPGLQRLLATGWDELPASLARVLAYHPRWIYTGHSPRPLPASCLSTPPKAHDR